MKTETESKQKKKHNEKANKQTKNEKTIKRLTFILTLNQLNTSNGRVTISEQ